MNDADGLQPPSVVAAIGASTAASKFVMASDSKTGSLLRTLAASKPAGAFLELGTGTGLSSAWILDGMDRMASLVTVDNDPAVVAIARQHLEGDPRVAFHVADGGEFLQGLEGQSFGFIFADTWPGKYTHLEQTLALLNPGGLYVIDDMLPQPNWPADHPPKVAALIGLLETRSDLRITKLNWSTGIIVWSKLLDTKNREIEFSEIA